MAKKMLIDATHPEETRVVVVDGNKVEEFDFESVSRRPIVGNIYLAKVTRVEPSLQAAFVDYGGNRHGFLAFSEIHPDYYQIPVADREALVAEEAAAQERTEAREAAEDDAEAEGRTGGGQRRHRRRRRRQDKVGTGTPAEEVTPEGRAGDAPSAGADIPGLEVIDVESGGEEEGAAGDDGGGQAANMAGAVEPSALPERAGLGTSEAVAELPAEADEGEEAGEADTGEADTGEADTEEADTEDADTEESNTDEVAADEAESGDIGRRGRRRRRARGDDAEGADDEAAEVEAIEPDESQAEAARIRARLRRRYKIQDVIKVRQIMLVQVVKEERGNKGAALTTYLSLAGRYCVLMPNTARGGGVSRKITSAADRKRLREIINSLDVPPGMGLIVRTAGAGRTKAEIKRDYEFLLRQWEQIRDKTLKSVAPTLIHEEGSLIKRAIRDLYSKEIDAVLVEGEAGYREAKDYMKMLMPSHARHVQQYSDQVPLFVRYQVESYLNAMFSPVVQLKSGGYIVINQTEALVAIDVNSGRSTREGSVEETALKTNLEAAEEIARQLRLRDLAGLIVIDFIDMDDPRNNRAVEKRLKEKLKNDRARLQIGRISPFGLLEMSRQRLRSGMVEMTTQACPHCHGQGVIRSDESLALMITREIEAEAVRSRASEITVRAPVAVANYVINTKRAHLAHIEERYGVRVTVLADPALTSPEYRLERSGTRATPETAEPIARGEDVKVAATVESPAADREEKVGRDEKAGRGRRRRGRRGGRRRRGEERAAEPVAATATGEQPAGEQRAGETGAEATGAEATGTEATGTGGESSSAPAAEGGPTGGDAAAAASGLQGESATESATESAAGSGTEDREAAAAPAAESVGESRPPRRRRSSRRRGERHEEGVTEAGAPAEAGTAGNAGEGVDVGAARAEPAEATAPGARPEAQPSVAATAADAEQERGMASPAPARTAAAAGLPGGAGGETDAAAPAPAEAKSAEPAQVQSAEAGPDARAGAAEAPGTVAVTGAVETTGTTATEPAEREKSDARPKRRGWWQFR